MQEGYMAYKKKQLRTKCQSSVIFHQTYQWLTEQAKMYEIENLWYYLGDYDRLSNECMFLFKHNLVKNIPIELSKLEFLTRRIHGPY